MTPARLHVPTCDAVRAALCAAAAYGLQHQQTRPLAVWQSDNMDTEPVHPQQMADKQVVGYERDLEIEIIDLTAEVANLRRNATVTVARVYELTQQISQDRYLMQCKDNQIQSLVSEVRRLETHCKRRPACGPKSRFESEYGA